MSIFFSNFAAEFAEIVIKRRIKRIKRILFVHKEHKGNTKKGNTSGTQREHKWNTNKVEYE